MGASSETSTRLREEHVLIASVLDGADVLSRRVRQGAPVPSPAVVGAMDFFAGFVQGSHCAREDEGLYPVLARHGEPHGTSFAALSAEHAEGNRLVGALRPLVTRGRLDGEAIDLFESYVGSLRRHVGAEDASVLEFADRVMTRADERRVRRAFERIDAKLGPEAREAQLALANAVVHACRALGDATPRPPGERRARDAVRPRAGVVSPDDSLARAARIMDAIAVRELPVVERDALVGVLSRSDLEPHRGHFEWTPVRAAMTADPVTVDADAPLAPVARVLLERSFNSVPVVAGHTLVGMVGRADLLRLLAES